MTTMMTVALALLVIIVTAFIIVLVFWKKDSKQRNESIRALEKRLDEVVHELADGNKINSTTKNDISDEKMDRLIQTLENMNFASRNSVVSESVDADIEASDIDDEWLEERVGEEISFDFLELDGLEGYEEFDVLQEAKTETPIETQFMDEFEIDIGPEETYNTGRSGKKYTAEELEALIKE